MANLKVTTNNNGTLILQMPAGEFKWKGGGWSVSHGIGRPVLNALVNYCQQRQFKMSKKEIMESLTDPKVLSALFFGWDQPQAGVGQTKDDFRVGQRVFHAKMGNGIILEKKVKNLIVQFDRDIRKWRCHPENLKAI